MTSLMTFITKIESKKCRKIEMKVYENENLVLIKLA